ncbi:MAG: flagellar filament capping protein FliD [Bacillota bacterium]|nr:flagellar filament capping protein FliD [Bacillota bacterium]
MANITRIGGLASGMDIDSLVSTLMKAERAKADKLYQSRQVLQWQQEDFRSINSLLLSFRSVVSNMRLQSTIRKNNVVLSKDGIASVTAGASAMEGSYTLKVNRLAEQASKVSGGTLSRALEGAVLDDLPITIDDTSKEFSITLDGVKKTITLTQGVYNTVEELRDEIQSQIDKSGAFGPGQINVGVSEGRLTFEPAGEYKPQIVLGSGENDALGVMGFSDGDSYKISMVASLKDISEKFTYSPFAGESGIIEFKINGQLFSYDFNGDDAGKSLTDIIRDINRNLDAGVEAYYDAITDKMVVKSRDYGIGAQVSIENIEGNLFGAEGALQIDSDVSYGQNSEIVLNGVVINKNSNKFTIDGINYDLKATSTDTISMSVQRDIQGAFDAIKSFVDEYNKIIETITGKLYEERFRSYAPLTSEQKDAMTDKEVELWEEKARSGLLRNDPVLSGILSGFRSLMYEEVKGTGSAYNTLNAIGIKTQNYMELGKLHVDDSKLMEALNSDLEGVMNLFTRSSETDSEKGIAVRLYDAVNSGISRLSEKAGSATSFTIYDNSYLGERIRDMDKRIDSMESYLERVEDRYWRQFTAMEKALNEMNTQSLWLSQQLTFWGN